MGSAPQSPAPPAPWEWPGWGTPTSLGPDGSPGGGHAELPGPVHAGRPTAPTRRAPWPRRCLPPAPPASSVVSSPRVGYCGGFQEPLGGEQARRPPFLQSGLSLMLWAPSKAGPPLSSPPGWQELRTPTLVSGTRVVSDLSLPPRPIRYGTFCPRWSRGQAGFSWKTSSAATASGHWSTPGAGRPPPGGPCPPQEGGRAPGAGGRPPRAGHPPRPGLAARCS